MRLPEESVDALDRGNSDYCHPASLFHLLIPGGFRYRLYAKMLRLGKGTQNILLGSTCACVQSIGSESSRRNERLGSALAHLVGTTPR